VVNLRSAISAAEAGETERQLKLLTIQRLSGEPQLFVLERQQMGLLGAEKDLQADDSAFWNGSYLFEGVVDQNGYSTETITINARLSPPKGGAPVTFEVSGSRTNLAAVVNQLAMKVEAALKVHPTVTEWNAADEARQYFKEAQWALRWGVYEEAQAAADSAWALGKQDLECAVLRMRAYLLELSGVVGGYRYIQHGRYPGVFEMPNLSPVNPTTRFKPPPPDAPRPPLPRRPDPRSKTWTGRHTYWNYTPTSAGLQRRVVVGTIRNGINWGWMTCWWRLIPLKNSPPLPNRRRSWRINWTPCATWRVPWRG